MRMNALRKYLKIVLLTMAIVVAAFVSFAFLALQHTDPPMPKLDGSIEHGTLQHGGRTRTWIAYVPARPAKYPALVITLHGSMGSGQQARAESFGYDFDVLADREGFIAVYPQGYQGYWNDCKVKGPFSAKRENVDDVGFLRALVARLVEDRSADPARVYVTGVSNGGSMALCLALLTPDFARAYAVVSASVPTQENMILTPTGRPASILFMNGTDDPIVPWKGGDVVLWPVLRSRGPVLSVQGSVDYFRILAGLDSPPRVTRFPDIDSSDGSTVVESLWSAPGKHSVALYTVRGGGHAAPHPAKEGMCLLGNSNRDIHAASEIWSFFQEESP